MGVNKTKQLLKEINKLTNDIEKLLKSNSPNAKKILKSIAGKAKEQGIIISDDLTDKEVAEVIRRSPKAVKQAIIYAVQNDLPNLKSLHKGKKGIKLDKAYTSGKKLSFAIAPDKPVEAPSSVKKMQRAIHRQLHKDIYDAKREEKKRADKAFKEMYPHLWEEIERQKKHARSLRKELGGANLLAQLEKKLKKKQWKADQKQAAKEEKEILKWFQEELKKKEEAKQLEEREIAREKEESMINAILDFRKAWNEKEISYHMENKDVLKRLKEDPVFSQYYKDTKREVYYQSRLLTYLSRKYGFEKEDFLKLTSTNLNLNDKKFMDYLLKKFDTPEAKLEFFTALKNATPYIQSFNALFKHLDKAEKQLDTMLKDIPQDLYILPKSKEIPMDVEFKSGLTNEQLENLRNSLEVFKLIAENPTTLNKEKMSAGAQLISIYAKISLECISLKAKLLSVITNTEIKTGGNSWDNTFWWFATYKSKETLDNGVTVDKGFVIDWKGVHIRMENFLRIIPELTDREGVITSDIELSMFANDIRTIAQELENHYERYKDHVEEGPLGSIDASGAVVFNIEGFQKTKQIGDTYQSLLIKAQQWISSLHSYCREAINMARTEVTKFAKRKIAS